MSVKNKLFWILPATAVILAVFAISLVGIAIARQSDEDILLTPTDAILGMIADVTYIYETNTPTPTITPSITPTHTPIPPTATPTLDPAITPTIDMEQVLLSHDLHTVQGGESLALIASYYNVTIRELVSVNELPNSNVIYVGQQLLIPRRTPTPRPTLVLQPIIDYSATIVADIPDDLLAAIIPPPPSAVNDIAYDDFLWMPDAVVANIQSIHEKGLELGRDPHAFTRTGDSTIEPPVFMTWFDTGRYELGGYSYLERTVRYFAGSYNHNSVAVRRGLHSWSVFDPMWAPPNVCIGGEHMLECELRRRNPSIIIVRLGSNDRGRPQQTEDSLREVIEFSIGNGVIPIMGTKADRFDIDNHVNGIIRDLAYEYNVPLWDFDLLADSLPGRGLTSDGVHLTGINAYNWTISRGFNTGYGVHNLTALIALDEVRQVITQS